MGQGARTLCLACLTALVCAAAAPAVDLAFTFVQVGEELPDLQLAGPRTAATSYLGGDGDQARVFVFLKDGRDSSDRFLETLSGLQRKFAQRPVHWSLIVSDRTAPDWADTVCARCPGVSVLRDEGDRLYGTLGVPLTPVVGIADGENVLRAYLTYRKINFGAVIEAHVLHVLGDIDDAQLESRLSPRGRMRDSTAGSVARKLKLARMLLDKEKFDSARKQVDSAIAEAPDAADAWALLAEIHAATGDGEQAAFARARADSLADADGGTAPEDPEDQDGKPSH